MGNPTVQIRIDEHLKKKFEDKAREQGFLKPNGEVNLSAWFKNLGLNEITKVDKSAE